MKLIHANERLAFLLFLAVLVMLPVSYNAFRKDRRRWVWLGAHVTLLVLNPTWWISAISGDCGFLLKDFATATTVVAGVGTARAAWLARRRGTAAGVA
jgi:hypothetical protein